MVSPASYLEVIRSYLIIFLCAEFHKCGLYILVRRSAHTAPVDEVNAMRRWQSEQSTVSFASAGCADQNESKLSGHVFQCPESDSRFGVLELQVS